MAFFIFLGAMIVGFIIAAVDIATSIKNMDDGLGLGMHIFYMVLVFGGTSGSTITGTLWILNNYFS